MPGPRKLWRTDIVIWSEWDPQKTPVSALAREGEGGRAYISKAHSEHVPGPFNIEDGPSEEFLRDLDGESA
jgi:hypothetical protein